MMFCKQQINVKSSSRTSSPPESLTASPVGVNNAALTSLPMSLSQLAMREALQGIQSALSTRFGNAFNHQQRFHPYHGRNVVLKNNGQTAQRTASYNQVNNGLFSISNPFFCEKDIIHSFFFHSGAGVLERTHCRRRIFPNQDRPSGR